MRVPWELGWALVCCASNACAYFSSKNLLEYSTLLVEDWLCMDSKRQSVQGQFYIVLQPYVKYSSVECTKTPKTALNVVL